MSALEAFANAAIGLVVSWIVTYAALPIWGLSPSAGQSAAITGMYFIVSFARSWAIRAAFKKYEAMNL